MSEAAPEAPARGGGGGIKGTFTNKIGPLPMWIWLVIVTVILVAWRLYASRKANAQQASSAAQTSDVSAADVPQFVNQTYVSTSPPTAGPPGPAGPAGPPGQPGTPSPVTRPEPRPAAHSGGTPLPAMPTGIRATKVTGNSIAAAWQKVAGASSYLVRVTYQGKLVKQMTTHNPSAVITGLGPDHTYTVHVAAIGPGGQSSESNGPAIKTMR